MGLIVYLILGGIVGWLASIVTKNDPEFGVIGNIIVGIVGSFVGSYLINPIFGIPSALVVGIVPLFGAFLGSVIALLVYNWIRRATR